MQPLKKELHRTHNQTFFFSFFLAESLSNNNLIMEEEEDEKDTYKILLEANRIECELNEHSYVQRENANETFSGKADRAFPQRVNSSSNKPYDYYSPSIGSPRTLSFGNDCSRGEIMEEGLQKIINFQQMMREEMKECFKNLTETVKVGLEDIASAIRSAK